MIQRTIFDTPGVNTLLRAGSRLFLRLNGWTTEGQLPAEARKAVLIAAPHTSNWDLPYTLMVAFCLDLRPYWMGKSSIFRFPFGGLMRWLGGISIDRDKRTNTVGAAADAIRSSDGPLHLIVSPEGTRSRARDWRTGFYYIALEAKVPIIMAFMDYERRRSGLGPLFQPTGDVERDIADIRGFYADFKGRNPSQFDSDPT